MKINELLESRTKKELHKGSKAALPGLRTWHELDNNNDPYLALRFGMLCAGSPDFNASEHISGPIGGKLSTINYSSAEEEIINAAAKKMGLTGKRVTSNKSHEKDDVHKVSPVSSWNKPSKAKKD